MGDFLGRAALEVKRSVGASKKKVCFTVDSDEICLVGLEAIVRDGEYVGHVRRGELAYGYINHPRGEKVTKRWLEDAEYQIESRGKLYNAELHLKTPFDSANNRLHGFYEADQGLVQHQEQKLLDYRNLL